MKKHTVKSPATVSFSRDLQAWKLREVRGGEMKLQKIEIDVEKVERA
jgi:hypothetical protein